MAKKFEKTVDKVTRYKEELRMGCTTEKGIPRPLTREEVSLEKGFVIQLIMLLRLKVVVKRGY